jgi:hypothetical protein
MKALTDFFRTSPRTKGQLLASLFGLIIFLALLTAGLISMVNDPKIGWLGAIGPLSMGIIIITAGIAMMNPPAFEAWLRPNHSDDPKK